MTALAKDHKAGLIKLIKAASYTQATWEVYSDFVEMAAIAISNSVDRVNRKKREEKYLNLISKYDKKRQPLFGQMLGELVMAMERAVVTEGGPTDILGPVYHELELHNKWVGQFFTPVNICDMMGQLVLNDGLAERAIKDKGYITLDEPCTGSGAMILSFAKALARRLESEDFNYQTQLFVSARDIDLKCVCMTYIQLSLYNIPAIVTHGDTLSLKEWDRWYTPAYILNGWESRLRRKKAVDKVKKITSTTDVQEPLQLSLFDFEIKEESA